MALSFQCNDESLIETQMAPSDIYAPRTGRKARGSFSSRTRSSCIWTVHVSITNPTSKVSVKSEQQRIQYDPIEAVSCFLSSVFPCTRVRVACRMTWWLPRLQNQNKEKRKRKYFECSWSRKKVLSKNITLGVRTTCKHKMVP